MNSYNQFQVDIYRDMAKTQHLHTDVELLYVIDGSIKVKLKDAVFGNDLIYVISEPEQLALLPDGAIRVLVHAPLDTIKDRFRKRMHGDLPAPVEKMLEKKHGMFDAEPCDYRFDGLNGDAADLREAIKERMTGAHEK